MNVAEQKSDSEMGILFLVTERLSFVKIPRFCDEQHFMWRENAETGGLHL